MYGNVNLLNTLCFRRMLYDDSRGVGEALDESVCVGNTCEGLTVHFLTVIAMLVHIVSNENPYLNDLISCLWLRFEGITTLVSTGKGKARVGVVRLVKKFTRRSF